MNARLRMGLRVLAITVVSLVLLALVTEEVVAWKWPRGPEDEARARDLAVSIERASPCLVESDGRLTHARISSYAARPGSFPAARTPGVPRIAFVGESGAWFLGDAVASSVAAGACGRAGAEVLVCGVPGGGRAMLSTRFEEVLAYRPDAIVAVFAHNFRWWDPPPPLLALKAEQLRESSRVLSLLSRPAPDQPPRATRLAQRDPYEPEAGLDADRIVALERRLVELSKRAKSEGIPLVLSTMGSNLRFPPTFTQEELEDPVVLTARVDRAQGRVDAAIAALEAKARTSTSPFWPWLAGEWMVEAGRRGEAKPLLLEAVRREERIPRAPAALNEMIRRVAATTSTALFDLDRMVDDVSPAGVPGFEAFHDCCHAVPSLLDAQVRALVSRLTSLSLWPESCAPAPVGKPGPVILPNPGTVASVVASDPSSLVRWSELLPLMVSAPFATDPVASRRVLESHLEALKPLPERIAALYRRGAARGAWLAGARELAWSINASSTDPGAAVDRVLFLLETGRVAEARAALASLPAPTSDVIARALRD